MRNVKCTVKTIDRTFLLLTSMWLLKRFKYSTFWSSTIAGGTAVGKEIRQIFIFKFSILFYLIFTYYFLRYILLLKKT